MCQGWRRGKEKENACRLETVIKAEEKLESKIEEVNVSGRLYMEVKERPVGQWEEGTGSPRQKRPQPWLSLTKAKKQP